MSEQNKILDKSYSIFKESVDFLVRKNQINPFKRYTYLIQRLALRVELPWRTSYQKMASDDTETTSEEISAIIEKLTKHLNCITPLIQWLLQKYDCSGPLKTGHICTN